MNFAPARLSVSRIAPEFVQSKTNFLASFALKRMSSCSVATRAAASSQKNRIEGTLSHFAFCLRASSSSFGESHLVSKNTPRHLELNCRMGNKSSKKHYKVPPNAARPDPPGKPEAETQETGVYLQWMSPSSNGNCPIIGYVVQHLELDDGTWHSSNSIPGNECLIHNLENGTAYQFRVVAENLIGYSSPSVPSEPILFTTSSAHPRFVTKLHNVLAIENEKVEFHVQIIGRPNPRIRWYLNGDEIMSNSNFTVDNQRLTIKRATSETQGEIKCSASNEVGMDFSTAELSVGAPPRILEDSSREIIFRVDEFLRIKFTFSGRPKPEVSWFHNGMALDENLYTIETLSNSSSLKLENANRDHRGEYTVKVENNLGMDTCSVLVTVADKPNPPSVPTIVLLRDNSCLLEWQDGNDDGGCPVQCYIVEYYRTGWDVWLTGATPRSKVTKIRDLISGSKYKFRVKAENLYGVSDHSGESVEIFIPELSSGLMTTLPEDEEEADKIQIMEINRKEELSMPRARDFKSIDDSKIQKPASYRNGKDNQEQESKFHTSLTKPTIAPTKTNGNGRNTSPVQSHLRFQKITNPSLQSSTPRKDSLIFDHYTSISTNRRSTSPSPLDSNSKVLDSLNLSSRTLDRFSKPWNQPQQLDSGSRDEPEPNISTQSKACSLPRDLSSKFILMNPSPPPPRNSSSASSSTSHLIFEGSSSDEEDDKSIVTCSSLTVLKSGNLAIKTCSREELTRSFDNISKTTSPSKNSLNSEDFEYYNSIFGKTCYNVEDEEADMQGQMKGDGAKPEKTTAVEDQSEAISGSPPQSENPEEENAWSWWWCLIIPVFICVFLKYTLFTNIGIMLYVFYHLVMLFFE